MEIYSNHKKIEWLHTVDIQSDNVLKKKSFRFAIVLSKSTKLRLFLSHQMHYIKQWGTAF